MLVTSTGPQTLQKAEGERLTLGCPPVLHSGTTYIHGDSALGKGFKFAAPDPSMGDASMSISPLSPAHSATYQCKVKKSPGVDARKVSLVVMAKPSVPQCWAEGGELIGGAVSLHCQSVGGSTPLLRVSGELRIRNHSQSSAGFYLCEVNNALQQSSGDRRSIVGSLLLIFILLVFIGLIFWKLSSRRGFEKEFSNDIRYCRAAGRSDN
ncbi:hypothetical protein F7725_015334 [Dissostichus mawsoni]|uniref:Ig-like domain-containing protein n=1 Tax=Dissostichus mawsoni TaxID=36200 RepID=A0A7J5YK19_DISMA|nr:hypothetical protein F7725_015334 [Dissostichus mawsoni]